MENKRFVTVITFIVLLIIVLPIVNYFGSKAGKAIITNFDTALEAENYTFIEMGREGCSYCTQQAPILEDLATNSGLVYTYIDTGKLKSSQLSHIIEVLDINQDDWGTPTMAIIGKGVVHEVIEGLSSKEELSTVLSEYGLIGEYETKELINIDYTEYYKKIKSKKPVVIVIEKEGCYYCEKANPSLKRASFVTNTDIYVLDAYDAIAGTKDDATAELKEISKKFYESLPIYKEEEWGTPLIMIVENGKVKASYLNGYASAETYISFLQDNGIGK